MSKRTSMSGWLGFFRTLALLLKTARQRSTGRSKHQRELRNQRTGSSSDEMQKLGLIMAILWMAIIHGMAAHSISQVTKEADRYTAEKAGQVVVSDDLYAHIVDLKANSPSDLQTALSSTPDRYLRRAAKDREETLGGSYETHLAFYKKAILDKPLRDFIPQSDIHTELNGLKYSSGFTVTLGSLLFIWWIAMLVFQGDGLELDIQRRRHPMWEWLLSHPVHPGAVFLAEMLSPIASNPTFLTAPLFAAILFGQAYGASYGLLACFVIGIPLTIAASCLGKSLETAMMLRMKVRTRGAIIGIMGWLSYVALISFAFMSMMAPRIVHIFGRFFFEFAQAVPCPILLPILGNIGSASAFWAGMLACWFLSASLIAIAIGICIWGTQNGLAGNAGASAPATAPRSEKLITILGRDPLYKKELLWFIRDKSAVVQVILIPVTIAAIQLINFRHLIKHADKAWHTLSGAAVIFGTYFLWVLGPRSLASEGAALWIAQTWPRGMEDLLKAKARLWFMISSLIVGSILLFAAIRFPSELWKLALVGIGWAAFGHSMAEKCVTLVAVTKENGETEKIPVGRRMAAALGMLSFGIGILTQQWQLAALGIVYSWITAAAMWQNFRARLPYLYDPWEEKLPAPPTVMHAMIAISVLVELGAVVTSIIVIAASGSSLGIARLIAHALISFVVMSVTISMMNCRELPLAQTWRWKNSLPDNLKSRWIWCGSKRTLLALACACVIGTVLGATWALVAHGYINILAHFEPFKEAIQGSKEFLETHHQTRVTLFISAVFIAPVAEEYLFRGLLFRALDREWGGWKALIGSAAFFAIYHPPMAWLPVGILGLASAWLFKKTGNLTPCVLLHMAYNALVFAR
jgi:membrane protease YdiL (CAAX protease family)